MTTDDERGPGSETGRRTGRRPGVSGSRDQIAAAARRQFGDVGYDRTTIRSIAAEVGVDPALVIHFFGTKQQLFGEAVALPFDPAQLIASIVNGPVSERGTRLARFVVTLMADPVNRSTFTALVRAATSEPHAARLLRARLTEHVFLPLAQGLDIDRAEVRAELAASQMVGLIMGRDIIGMDALVGLSGEELVALLGPTLQRYLAEDL